MVFVSLGSNLTFVFEMLLQQTALRMRRRRRRRLQSSKLLRRLDKPDVFHMEMSECLRDFAHVGDENVVCSAVSELVFC